MHPVFPGKNGKGDAFPRATVLPRLPATAVLLGRSVARAYGHDAPWFEWRPVGRKLVAAAPHPSGISHFWNDPRNTRRARRF